MFSYAWEFHVRADKLREFEAGYGPRGDWARLFGRDPDYLRTDLLRDCRDKQRFVTVDFWKSRDSCMAFRRRFADEFRVLDEQYEAMTESEVHLGDFQVLE